MPVIEKNLKVKVLVLGDSGVGKSSFTQLLCHNQSSKTPGYTIGCTVEIKLHDFKQGTAEEKTYCVEIWDIGASKSHNTSRYIFYNNVNGIILAHDLTNLKSLQNLSKWLNDALSQDTTGGLSSIKVGSSASRNSGDDNSPLSIPVLMVGTKLDQFNAEKRQFIISRSKSYADEIGCKEIHLSTIESKYIAAGSGNAVELSRFFDQVVDHAIIRQATVSSVVQSPVVDRRGSFGERRRQNVTPVSRLFGMKRD
ncbi:rab-like protein 3 [Clavelina lepadiformis]|uniref:rab-like protein 3 n=1 Tax=Clavelina lepadiformis TaxID=159417 RepID=UPI00404360B6